MNYLTKTIIYMNYTTLFYWLTVADNARSMFATFVIIFTAISVISLFAFFVGRDEDGTCPADGVAERSKKWLWNSIPFTILFWALLVFTPSKRDALLIVAGGQTLNYLSNDSVAKQIPHAALDFVVTELKGMAGEANLDLGIQTQKEKILESAKKMTTDELLDKMKVDTTFSRIILGRK